MKFQPKFRRNDPKTKEEKLICEFIHNLNQVSKDHINMNKAQFDDKEIFLSLRDGAIGYAGTTIEALIKIMEPGYQQIIFLEECKNIFESYLEQASENIK